MHTFHDYSRQLKIFYHRYILCDKQYHLTPIHQYRLGSAANVTTVTYRGSSSPQNYHNQCRRTSTI